MKEIDNTPIENLDIDWGNPDGKGNKAKSLEQVQTFIKNKIRDLSGEVFDFIVEEEYATFEWIANRNDITDKSIYLLKNCYQGLMGPKDGPLFVYKKDSKYVLPIPEDENLSDPIYKHYLDVTPLAGLCSIKKNKRFLFGYETYTIDGDSNSIIKIGSQNIPLNFQFIDHPIVIINISDIQNFVSIKIYEDVYFAKLHGCFVKKISIDNNEDYFINQWCGSSVYNKKNNLFTDGSNLYVKEDNVLVSLNKLQSQMRINVIDTIDENNYNIYMLSNEMVYIKNPITFPALHIVLNSELEKNCRFKIVFSTSDTVPTVTFNPRLKWKSAPVFKPNFTYCLDIDFHLISSSESLFIAEWAYFV